MKAAGAIATTQAAQTLVITPAMVCGASLATGLVWLVLGLTGTARYVANLVSRPVVLGIVLGLGFGFMIESAKMMSQNSWVGAQPCSGHHCCSPTGLCPQCFCCSCSAEATAFLATRHCSEPYATFTLTFACPRLCSEA
jgi:hypothetical protein